MNNLALLAFIVWKIDLKQFQGLLANVEVLAHKNRQYGAPSLCFHRILLAFMMHTLQNFSPFVKMMLKWKDIVSSIAFPIVDFCNSKSLILCNLPALPIEC